MIVINFTHPLTDEQQNQIENLTGEPLAEIIDVPVHLDPESPFVDQVIHVVDGVGLTSTQWQTEPILINPPALNVIVAILLAELHGRMGHFPAVIRLKPVEGGVVQRYAVAEVVNLQRVRDKSRPQRGG